MPLFLLVMSAVTAIGAPDGGLPRSLTLARAIRSVTTLDRNVRSVTRPVTDLLLEGARRSTTFARLLAALDGSDVIVYVELTQDLPSAIQGRLVLTANTDTCRYVRIQIRAQLTRDEIIAVIGHELRHAIEVAEAPWLRDQNSMRRHYERLGAGSSRDGLFDTRAARDAGWRVRAELRLTA